MIDASFELVTHVLLESGQWTDVSAVYRYELSAVTAVFSQDEHSTVIGEVRDDARDISLRTLLTIPVSGIVSEARVEAVIKCCQTLFTDVPSTLLTKYDIDDPSFIGFEYIYTWRCDDVIREHVPIELLALECNTMLDETIEQWHAIALPAFYFLNNRLAPSLFEKHAAQRLSLCGEIQNDFAE